MTLCAEVRWFLKFDWQETTNLGAPAVTTFLL